MEAIVKLLSILYKAILFKKEKYRLEFIKEDDGKWYANIPDWPKKYHKNLEMVFGSNRLLDKLNKDGSNRVWMFINPKSKSDTTGNLFLERTGKSLFNGAFYKVFSPEFEFREEIWICPVTLFFLGYYPKNMVITYLQMDIGR